MSKDTNIDRKSDRELVVTRTFNGPARIVWKAWTTPDLFRSWWVPKSSGISLLSCEMDIRTGGGYRLVFAHPSGEGTMAFFGTYLEVTPTSRMQWTNEEGDGEGALTTVTFEDRGDVTLVVLTDLYPSKEALDEAMESGAIGGFGEQFEQLDALLPTLDAV